MEFPPFLTDAVLAPLAFVLLGAVALKLVAAFRHRRNFLVRALPLKVWHLGLTPLQLRAEPVALAYGLIPPDAMRLPYYVVEDGDVTALYQLVSLLRRMYGDNLDVQNHKDIHPRLQKTPNVVTVSGPAWNSATELYIGLCGSPVKFDLHEGDLRLIIEPRSGEQEILESTYTPDHRPIKCYGIILGGRANLPGTPQNVLLLGGNSNLSTFASALLLEYMYRDRATQRALSRYKLSKQERWLVLFSVENWLEGTKWFTSPPPIKVGVFKVEIERVFVGSDFVEPYRYQLAEVPVPWADSDGGYGRDDNKLPADSSVDLPQRPPPEIHGDGTA